jgi:hypothetical protein
MKIPKKLKILGHIVTVRETEDMEDCGQFDVDKNEIRIRKQLSQSQKEEALIHEILGMANPTFHSEHHSLLEALAQTIYQALKDNNLLK